MNANVVIWPIEFVAASNNLSELYADFETKTKLIVDFLNKEGISNSEITINSPSITDRMAQSYGDKNKIKFRYTGRRSLTVYAKEVANVARANSNLINLGKEGVLISRS